MCTVPTTFLLEVVQVNGGCCTDGGYIDYACMDVVDQQVGEEELGDDVDLPGELNPVFCLLL